MRRAAAGEAAAHTRPTSAEACAPIEFMKNARPHKESVGRHPSSSLKKANWKTTDDEFSLSIWRDRWRHVRQTSMCYGVCSFGSPTITMPPCAAEAFKGENWGQSDRVAVRLRMRMEECADAWRRASKRRKRPGAIRRATTKPRKL